ncbi:HepT-like ribonuclease domain-containing protein [Spirulina major]|uniref:HepT-like ribonuclease domain-containing protein n=1 Tax=Spirulina major TaxID=270636 RepID=UPI001C3123A3|nr:HepT-like ribonuclease domain-containing protein [Spirulina major]
MQRINRRFAQISHPDDFLDTDRGQDLLDAISMMLIAIGENLKWLDRETNGKIFAPYPQVNWRGAKGVRDVLAHRYFDIDAEEIFTLCQKQLPEIINAIQSILNDYED